MFCNIYDQLRSSECFNNIRSIGHSQSLWRIAAQKRAGYSLGNRSELTNEDQNQSFHVWIVAICILNDICNIFSWNLKSQVILLGIEIPSSRSYECNEQLSYRERPYAQSTTIKTKIIIMNTLIMSWSNRILLFDTYYESRTG